MKTRNNYSANYQRLILDCIEEGLNGEVLNSDADKCQYLADRIKGEYGWMIERVGLQSAIVEWLMGMAINIPSSYLDIINLAKANSVIPHDATESQESKVCDGYWKVMSMQIIKLLKKHKINI
jgi:hypothetical protein